MTSFESRQAKMKKGFKGKERIKGAPSVKGEREPWRQILREGFRKNKAS
jgi:hypothetical protein